MFCPQCHAEYRPGFVRCSDCEVDLVEQLPRTALAVSEPPSTSDAADNEDPFVSFWRGDDPRIHAELCELFAQHGIPYRTLRRQERLFAFSSRIGFAIGIPFSRFDEAESLVAEAYATGDSAGPHSAVLVAERSGTPVSKPALLRYTVGSAGDADAWEEAVATPSEMQGSFVTLWAGEDPVLHTSLLEELRDAEIPFIDKPIGRDSVAPTSDPLPIDWKARFGFEVAVSSADIAAAEKILDKLLDEEPVDVELPAEDDVPPPAAAAPAPAQGGQTTSAVWSGDDSERAEFLSEALRENEIPVRLEEQANQSTLFVPPEEETLAREIIREILEGQPPA